MKNETFLFWINKSKYFTTTSSPVRSKNFDKNSVLVHETHREACLFENYVFRFMQKTIFTCSPFEPTLFRYFQQKINQSGCENINFPFLGQKLSEQLTLAFNTVSAPGGCPSSDPPPRKVKRKLCRRYHRLKIFLVAASSGNHRIGKLENAFLP